LINFLDIYIYIFYILKKNQVVN